jgi:hypothetical protein
MCPPGPQLQLRINATYDAHVTTFWIVSGGRYRTLLAVLALPFHVYEPAAHVWVVDAVGLLTLQDSGLRVEPGFLDTRQSARPSDHQGVPAVAHKLGVHRVQTIHAPAMGDEAKR